MTDSTARLWSRAQRYLSDGQLLAARIALESLLQRDPAHLHSLLTLSGIAFAEHRVRDAAAYALDAVRCLPADGSSIVEVANALLGVGETVAARNCLEHPVLLDTKEGNVLAGMASLRKMLGEHREALALFNQAAAAGEGVIDFRFQRALELIFNGQMDEAEAELKICLRLEPTFGRGALALTRLRKQTPEKNHLEDLKERLQDVERGTEDHAALEFAVYKELEDIGRYDVAWEALARGNAILYARQHHDPEYERQLFDNLIRRSTPQLLQPADVVHKGPQPIFIIGMPRSGTTLLDRVLGNHSQVNSAGELDDFGLQLRWTANHRTTLDEYVLERLADLDYAELGRRYLDRTQWRAQGARFFIDKLPRNWMVAGLIHRALPQARILNLVRDPMDVCFSNFRALLGDTFPWSYDLHALAVHYSQYRRVLAHWHAAMPGKIFDVPYSELTRDPETMTRTVLDYCGLEWEPGCADITRNKAAVATLSMSQVREPIHTRFFEEWRNYEQQLQPLRQAITA
ncbi:MAG: sulfotransferase [Rhodanobacter sp.]|jgi:tetratricopeptide (TPR) repeat protein